MAGAISLWVPIRLDGLYLEADGLQFKPPMADFSLLPYNLSDGKTTVNRDHPNLAEYAFDQSAPLSFPKGLHLHWALPDALTTGRHYGGNTDFPPVPNRWLVRRLDDKGALQKSVVVESDFLHPFDQQGRPTYVKPPAGMADWPPITFPTKRRQFPNDRPGAAFRYMGRSLPLEEWLLRPLQGDDYLNQRDGDSTYKFSPYPLTALGYGEPSFAAFYPNCHSVFGFCDADPNLREGDSYQYQVIGWFNESDLDPLKSKEFADLPDDAARYDALQREYRWCPGQADTKNPFPALTVFYGSLTLTPNKVKPWQPDESTFRLAIGNTGGEALAALLADGVAAQQHDNKVLIEDQLEALNVAAALQGVEVDYAAHFAQTRHQRGFRGLAGGSRWAVLPKQSPAVSAAVAQRDAAPQTPLPDAVAFALDALNSAQESYNMVQQEIVELRYQTFCDWHKFLIARYGNVSGMDFFRPQMDELGKFIAEQPLQLLQDKIAWAGTLTLTQEAARAEGACALTLALSTNTLTPLQPAANTLAGQVVLRLKALVDALSAAGLTDKFELASRPAENFWRPSEPVILLSGDHAVSTPRHGEDGDLACTVLTLPDAPGVEAFIDALAGLKPAGPDSPFTQTQSDPPWHPIILEWGTSVRPLPPDSQADPGTQEALDYLPTFITDSFTLRQNEPDVTPSNDGSSSREVLNLYQGRSLMTPTAGTQLDTSLRTFLLGATLDDCRDRTADGADYVDRLIKWYQLKHAITPPSNNAEKVPWLKQQRPFADPVNKDRNGNPLLLPVKELFDWYGEKPVKGDGNTVGKSWDAAQQARDPLYSAIRALDQLEGVPVLSQALGGFNAALLTRRQVLQIPIENPMQWLMSDYLRALDLTGKVAQAVGPHHPTAPLPARAFSPIRSGNLTLESLHLVDTFGQHWHVPLDGAHLVTSNGLSGPDQSGDITYLPPRLSTPARLNFRWLAALPGPDGADEVEMNSAPATTPICGWLLPNNFDDSLMVYDNTGRALGSINRLAEWVPAPGSDDRLAAAEIPNPHLRRLVRRLVVDVRTPDDQATIRQHFLQSFLSTLDSAAEAIEPAGFAQHEALALLMGRPVAVVRARVDLQLMGHPTDVEELDDPTLPGVKALRLKKSRRWKVFADQDWYSFASDWGRFYGCDYQKVSGQSCPFDKGVPLADYARTTHGFEHVRIPVRLGEHQLLNDGLVGFWKESADGELDNVFHAPQTLDDLKIGEDVTYQEGRTTPCIRAHAKEVADNLSLALQDDPLALTMLMDPRGVVHATSGLLPVYKLEIPSAYYADALKHMGVTFRVSPLLTDAEQLHAALPKEAGYVWSWVTRPDGSTWEETSIIADATEHAHFFKPPKLVEGWLKLTPKDEAEGEL